MDFLTAKRLGLEQAFRDLFPKRESFQMDSRDKASPINHERVSQARRSDVAFLVAAILQCGSVQRDFRRSCRFSALFTSLATGLFVVAIACVFSKQHLRRTGLTRLLLEL